MASSAKDLHLHFRILGSFLENVSMYRKPRIDAVKDIVLKTVASSNEKSAKTKDIKKILCINGIQIISSPVLNSAIQSLVQEEKLQYSQETKKYTCLVEAKLNGSGIIDIINNVYESFFSRCDNCTINDFSNALSSLFARYGCGSYESLQSSSSNDFVRVSSVINDLFKARGVEFLNDFSYCFEQFIYSKDPVAAKLKFQLVSTYAVLRMNGAGNWGEDALEKFIKDKTFAIDTNILFEVFATDKKQLLRVFEEIKKYGVNFVVGAETLKELEDTLRSKSIELINIINKGVDVGALLNKKMLNNEFLEAIYILNESPDAAYIESYTNKILADIDEWLEEIGAERVYLEKKAEDETRTEKIRIIQEKSLLLNRREKRKNSAYHDALLWELIEDKDSQGDMVISLDRTLSKISIGNKKRLSIMLDELMAYALLGNVSEEEMAEIFSYTLSKDLISDSDFFTTKDIETIASMEASILNASEPMLRLAIREINDKKVEAAKSGEAFEAEDIQRIVLGIISTYKEDGRKLEIERVLRNVSEEQNNIRAMELEKKLSTLSDRFEESERKQSKALLDYEVLKEHHGQTKDRSEKQKSWNLIFIPYIIISMLIYLFFDTAQIVAVALLVTTVISMLFVSFAPKIPEPSLSFIFLPSLPSILITIMLNWQKIQVLYNSVAAQQ